MWPFHKHKWRITGVEELFRFTPPPDTPDMMWIIGEQKYCPVSKILMVCDCGEVKTISLDGHWTLDQLQPQHAKEEADVAFFKSLKAELKEVNELLDLIRACDARAIKMWRKGHPERGLVQPDRTDMIFWLMEKLAVVEAAENYESNGDGDTTDAVKFLLASFSPGPWGGPHRWTNPFKRRIGKLMADYAKKYFNDNYQPGL